MPWSEKDASRHTKKATTAKLRRQWAAVANSVLEQTGDEGRAIAAADSAVARAKGKHRKK